MPKSTHCRGFSLLELLLGLVLTGVAAVAATQFLDLFLRGTTQPMQQQQSAQISSTIIQSIAALPVHPPPLPTSHTAPAPWSFTTITQWDNYSAAPEQMGLMSSPVEQVTVSVTPVHIDRSQPRWHIRPGSTDSRLHRILVTTEGAYEQKLFTVRGDLTLNTP
ncbi:prepilin-type N-terminal cleavage/methylation domain-containing protein [Desulfurispira natronophila]|uniref:Prepilin-type N-terminal cleavage/methylation domain-containing protein n=1 Tax=Desulfurispira natronophila TaxID=682562 RepID=A0A7W8DGZ7_9BACT|nr:prepilin-type N-terminal cleavage/methylation domain-containing protein [Desulfurispira natronophila]MBB5022051.1 prepilin-type N-terminal cleavage/methylation domain-containing protein [Desulfurispira natronophila]